MDGLSVASGVVGLLSLCIQVGKALSEYSMGVANAAESVRSLQHEFLTLEHVVTQLESFLRSQNLQDKSFNQTSVLCAAVGGCKDQVSGILTKLKRSDNGSISRAVRKLAWPFQEKEVVSLVEKLRRYIQTFEFSLTVEGWSVTSYLTVIPLKLRYSISALLSQTSKAVTAAMEKQLDTSKKIYEMTKDLSTFCALAMEASRTLNQIEDVLKLVTSFSDVEQELEDISSGIKKLEMRLEGKYRQD